MMATKTYPLAKIGASCAMKRGAAVLSMLLIAAPAYPDDLLSLYLDAKESDATYLSARADAAAEREAEPQALSRLLPNLSMEGSWSKNSTEQTSLNSVVNRTNEYDYKSHQYALVLRQPLFRPYNYAAYLQARARTEGAETSLAWATQEMAVRLGTAYFGVLLAESELAVNRAQQETYLAQMRHAQKAFAAGSGTRTDIDEAASHLDLARAEAGELEYRLTYAEDTLKVIVNRPITPLARLSPGRMPLIPPEPARLETWIEEAESANAHLKTLRAHVDAAEQEIRKARAGHLPTVDLVAQKSKSESDSTSTIGNRYDTQMVGVQVSIPLYSGGYVNSTERQAHAALDKARQQLEIARRDIGLQTRKAFDAALQGVQWVRAYEQAVQSAEQTLFSTQKGFQAGVRSTLDILTAGQNLASARHNLNRARYQYVTAHLNLLALVGRLDEQGIRRINAWLEAE